jgi:hypothetical protein
MITSMQNKHTNKKWTPKFQKLVFKLNIARTTLLKNQALRIGVYCIQPWNYNNSILF